LEREKAYWRAVQKSIDLEACDGFLHSARNGGAGVQCGSFRSLSRFSGGLFVRASLVDRIFGNSLRYVPDSMNDALVCDRHRRLRYDDTQGKNGT